MQCSHIVDILNVLYHLYDIVCIYRYYSILLLRSVQLSRFMFCSFSLLFLSLLSVIFLFIGSHGRPALCGNLRCSQMNILLLLLLVLLRSTAMRLIIK